MRSIMSRMWGLLRRYRVDRRLPPDVADLLASTTRLRLDDAARRTAASVRPVLGVPEPPLPDSIIARHGGHRLETSGVLDTPLAELGHRQARRMVDALQAAGLDPFVVARRDDGFEFGIEIEHRERALAVLGSALAGRGAYLAWEDGGRSGLVALSEASSDRHVRRARRWNIFTASAWGDRVLGESAGARLTFWQVGTSGQRELIGTRGQERFHVDSPRGPVVVDGREYPGVETFPVGKNLEEFIGDIDIVYTWVDGSDASWSADFELWSERERGTVPTAAFDPARFRSRDELRYSLRSVWAYCGWARRIYIVTSGQVPSWLREDERVRIVPHHAILPADVLPTFNSHAIESALHRIDGLAEHFLYFNDDVFIGRPLRPEAFFTPNGLPLAFQSSARVHGSAHADSLAVDTAARVGRALLQKRFGRVVSSKPYHAPFPLRRSLIDQLVDEFPDEITRTRGSRFRAPTDLSVAASFASHYALGLGRAVLGEINCQYLYVESDRLTWALDRIALARDVDTFCVNETKDAVGDHTVRERRLRAFFEEMYPVAAPWEK